MPQAQCNDLAKKRQIKNHAIGVAKVGENRRNCRPERPLRLPQIAIERLSFYPILSYSETFFGCQNRFDRATKILINSSSQRFRRFMPFEKNLNANAFFGSKKNRHW